MNAEESGISPFPTGNEPPISAPEAAAPSGGADLETFLRMTVAQGVSDIHLRVGSPPILRKDGNIITTKLPPLQEQDLRQFAKRIIPPHAIPKIKNRLDFDFAFDFEGSARFRANFLYEMNHLAVVLRVVPKRIPSLEDLGLPDVLKRFTSLHKGLVLITGPTGSGKSTTLAAMLNLINETSSKHIVTLEDPVEYIYEDKQSIITQRQIGIDTTTFPEGIKYALRQDPDVMLIGEMRDRETVMSAIHAAETGHVVFSTLHTIDAVQTINRIINMFEPHERDPIRQQLADILQGTVSQRLVRRLGGSGRIPVNEIMVVTAAVRDYIQKNEIDQIYHLLKEGDYEGMNSLNHSLYRAYRNELISMDEALATSENPLELQQMMRGAYHGASS